MKFLKFSSKTCQPCKALAQQIEAWDSEIQTRMTSLDTQADFEETMKYRVRGVPTMIVLNDAGEEVARYTGLSEITEDVCNMHLAV